MAAFSAPASAGAGSPLGWGRLEYVADLLGGAFELTFHEDGASPEALWDLYATSFGPLRAVAESLDADRRRQRLGELRRRALGC